MLDDKLYLFGGASNDDSGTQVYLNDMYTLEGKEMPRDLWAGLTKHVI